MPQLAELTPQRLMDFIWYMLTRNATSDEVEKLKAKLWLPPIGVTEPIPADSPWSAESEASAFNALKKGISSSAR